MRTSSGSARQIDARRPRVHVRIRIRAGRQIAGCAVVGFQPDLAGSVQLRRIRIERPLAVPVIEDARRPLPLLHRLAPVSCRQPAILSPGTARQLERAVAVARNLQEAQGGRLLRGALGQRKLPPRALDAREAALVLDRLAEFLVDGSHLGGGHLAGVAHAGEAEQVGRQLRAIGMEDEGPAHSQHAAEQAGFEHDIVSRRRLTGLGLG